MKKKKNVWRLEGKEIEKVEVELRKEKKATYLATKC